jgi:hypothetical protein
VRKGQRGRDREEGTGRKGQGGRDSEEGARNREEGTGRKGQGGRRWEKGRRERRQRDSAIDWNCTESGEYTVDILLYSVAYSR